MHEKGFENFLNLFLLWPESFSKYISFFDKTALTTLIKFGSEFWGSLKYSFNRISLQIVVLCYTYNHV